MKKIISIIFMVLVATFTYAQDATLTIGNVTANPGETVTIPVTLSSDTPVLAAELNMAFDNGVIDEGSITYTNFHPDFPEAEWFFNATGGVMLLNWVAADLTAVPVSGTITLFEIECDFIGGYTDIVWTLDLLVDQNSEVIPVNSVDGSLGETVEPEITVELPEITANAGSTINIPVTISGAGAQGTPILAAEFNIDFDNAVIDESSIEFVNFNELMPQAEWITNAAGGQMLLNWVSADLTAVAIPDGSVMFEVQCTYVGGNTDLVWSLALLVDENSQAVNTVTINGSVTSASPAMTAFNGTGLWTNPAFWSNGVPGSSSEAVIESGEAIVDAMAAAMDLTVNAGAAVTIEATGSLEIGNDLVLDSNTDNTPSGSLINNGSFTVSGFSYMKRWLSGGENHFISAPVSGITLNMLYNPANPGYFYAYDEPTKAWLNLYQLTTPLVSAQGYALNYENDELVEVEGNFNDAASYDATISYTEDKGGDDGWNLVGNPYPSALDWENGAWTKTNLEGGIYFYDGTNYQTYNGGYGVPATASQYIPAMQGFFVKAMSSGAELTVPKAAQVHSSQEYYKGNREVVDALRLKMSSVDYSDETLIRFAEEATSGFDAEMDAYKLFGFNPDVPQLFSVTNIYQTINALKAQESTTWDEVSVNLGFNTGLSGEYTLEASELESFTAGQVNTIELFDSETEEYIDLMEDPVYTFTADAGMNTSRFRVYFNRQIVGIGENGLNNVEIYSQEKTIYISNANGVAVVYSLSGQEIARKELVGNITNSISMISEGLYIVKVINGEGIAVEKVYLY